jgi:ferrochelatase
MADLVVDALAEPAQSVTEACVANMVGDVELQPLDERLGINTGGVQGVGAEGLLYQAKLQEKERVNARVAMMGVLITLMVELATGKPFTQMLASLSGK